MLSAACTRIVSGGALADKLTPVRDDDGLLLDDIRPGAAIHCDRPARDAHIAFADASTKNRKTGRLPKLGALHNAEAAVQTMHCFAHHELMAVELFAWALLRYTDAPAKLRRGWVQALHEEQTHLSLYLDAMGERGAQFGDFALSGYFWDVLPTTEKGALSALGFIAALGLTLEQANLDFTGMYGDAFARAGDDRAAAILKQIHEDEIRHVRLACRFFDTMRPKTTTFVTAYEAHVPFPLSGARAKGRRFDDEARRRAGVPEMMISYVQNKRPYE